MVKSKKNYYILFVLSFALIGIFSATFVSAACTNDNQIIMKLYSSTNSHAALWNDASYTIKICYNDIFGSNYAGTNPAHPTCTASNAILWLSSSSNAHVSSTQISGAYTTPVCYGNLTCRVISGNCNSNENTTLRLSSLTNAHVSVASDTAYTYKLCCKEGTSSGQCVPSTCSESYGILCGSAVPNGTCPGTTLNCSNNCATGYHCSSTTYGYCQPDDCNADCTNKAACADNRCGGPCQLCGAGKHCNSVGATCEDDHTYYPEVIITSPILDSKFKKGNIINFTATMKNLGANVEATWYFGDGNNTKLNCPTNGNCNTTHSYDTSGTKYIFLQVKNSSGSTTFNGTRIEIYESGINVFAVITNPQNKVIFSPLENNIFFNASASYVANCTTLACSNCYTVSDLKCYDLNKSDIPNKYNLWFNWTFSEPPKYLYGNWTENYGAVVEFSRLFYTKGMHYINLTVGYDSYTNIQWGQPAIIQFEIANDYWKCKSDSGSSYWSYWDDVLGKIVEINSTNNCYHADNANNATTDCCPLGRKCSKTGPTSGKCTLFANETYCGDYGTKSECQGYLNSVAEYTVNSTGGCCGSCSVAVGNGSEICTKVVDCSCEWVNNTCVASSEGPLLCNSLNNTPVYGECRYSSQTIDECSTKNIITYNWTADWFMNGVINNSYSYKPVDCSGGIPQTIKCSIAKLSFFTTSSLIVAILLVMFIYFWKSKKKK